MRTRPTLALELLALLAAWLHPAPSAARELWSTKDGRSVLELRGFIKSFGAGLRLPSGLVEGTEALQTMIDSARPALPSDQAALLPDTVRLPQYGGLSVHTARVWGKLVLRERLELLAGWQLAATIASDRTLVTGGGLGGGVPVSASQGARRRLWDFDPVVMQRDGLLLQHNLDLLAVRARFSFADVTVGRQVLSWGSGRLWNPTDLLSPFAPTDIDREVRRGVDAVRVSVPLAATAQLELLWLPQPEWGDHGFAARAQGNLFGFDVAPSVAKYAGDMVLGLDATGDVGPVAVHAELAGTIALERDAQGRRDEFVRAVAGLDYRPVEDLLLGVEYYFNGWGTTDPAAYADVMRSDRVTRGEVFGAGRHYLGLTARWQATELLGLQCVAIANLTDPSVILVPALEYWAEQSVLVRAGAYLPIGRTPDPSAARSLTPLDIAQQTDVRQRASGSLGLRSEYGSSAFGFFIQLGVYPL